MQLIVTKNRPEYTPERGPWTPPVLASMIHNYPHYDYGLARVGNTFNTNSRTYMQSVYMSGYLVFAFLTALLLVCAFILFMKWRSRRMQRNILNNKWILWLILASAALVLLALLLEVVLELVVVLMTSRPRQLVRRSGVIDDRPFPTFIFFYVKYPQDLRQEYTMSAMYFRTYKFDGGVQKHLSECRQDLDDNAYFEALRDFSLHPITKRTIINKEVHDSFPKFRARKLKHFLLMLCGWVICISLILLLILLLRRHTKWFYIVTLFLALLCLFALIAILTAKSIAIADACQQPQALRHSLDTRLPQFNTSIDAYEPGCMEWINEMNERTINLRVLHKSTLECMYRKINPNYKWSDFRHYRLPQQWTVHDLPWPKLCPHPTYVTTYIEEDTEGTLRTFCNNSLLGTVVAQKVLAFVAALLLLLVLLDSPSKFFRVGQKRFLEDDERKSVRTPKGRFLAGDRRGWRKRKRLAGEGESQVLRQPRYIRPNKINNSSSMNRYKEKGNSFPEPSPEYTVPAEIKFLGMKPDLDATQNIVIQVKSPKPPSRTGLDEQPANVPISKSPSKIGKRRSSHSGVQQSGYIKTTSDSALNTQIHHKKRKRNRPRSREQTSTCDPESQFSQQYGAPASKRSTRRSLRQESFQNTSSQYPDEMLSPENDSLSLNERFFPYNKDQLTSASDHGSAYRAAEEYYSLSSNNRGPSSCDSPTSSTSDSKTTSSTYSLVISPHDSPTPHYIPNNNMIPISDSDSPYRAPLTSYSSYDQQETSSFDHYGNVFQYNQPVYKSILGRPTSRHLRPLSHAPRSPSCSRKSVTSPSRVRSPPRQMASYCLGKRKLASYFDYRIHLKKNNPKNPKLHKPILNESNPSFPTIQTKHSSFPPSNTRPDISLDYELTPVSPQVSHPYGTFLVRRSLHPTKMASTLPTNSFPENHRSEDYNHKQRYASSPTNKLTVVRGVPPPQNYTDYTGAALSPKQISATENYTLEHTNIPAASKPRDSSQFQSKHHIRKRRSSSLALTSCARSVDLARLVSAQPMSTSRAQAINPAKKRIRTVYLKVPPKTRVREHVLYDIREDESVEARPPSAQDVPGAAQPALDEPGSNIA